MGKLLLPYIKGDITAHISPVCRMISALWEIYTKSLPIGFILS